MGLYMALKLFMETDEAVKAAEYRQRLAGRRARFPEVIDLVLQADRVQPFQVQSIEKDEMGIKLIWSAITIAYKDKPEETLPQALIETLTVTQQAGEADCLGDRRIVEKDVDILSLVLVQQHHHLRPASQLRSAAWC